MRIRWNKRNKGCIKKRGWIEIGIYNRTNRSKKQKNIKRKGEISWIRKIKRLIKLKNVKWCYEN